MKRYCKGLLCCLALGLILAGCTANKVKPTEEVPAFDATDVARLLKSGKYVPKAENYLIILDASQSMGDPYKYKGHTKFTFAKELVQRFYASLPDTGMSGGLRTFGHGACLPSSPTLAINEVKKHSKEELNAGLEMVACDGGPSPLTDALKEAAEDLSVLSTSGAPGSTAVILISDGQDMDERPIEAARQLSRRMDGLCYYAVYVGDKPEGWRFMQRLADVTGCAKAMDGSDIATTDGMTDFIKMALLKEASDADGDGVADHLDKCPNSPRGIPVDARGCARDRDGDGVYDSKDACPNTPRGVAVDSRGCPRDADGDGVPDYKDRCPRTPMGAVVNPMGCPVDTDGDGVPDYKDDCPNTPKEAPVNKFGCPLDK